MAASVATIAILLALCSPALAQSLGAPTITSVKPLSGGAEITFARGSVPDGMSVSAYVVDCSQAPGTVDQQTSTSAWC